MSRFYYLVVGLIAGFAVCYFATPEQEIKRSEKTQIDIKTAGEAEIVKKPGGTTITKVKWITEDKSKSEKKEDIKINPKRLNIEVGYMTDKAIYGHAQYTFWSPFIVGVHTEYNTSNSRVRFGAGLGISL